jgi:hypothetical protein
MASQERGAALIWFVIVFMVLTVLGGLGTYINYDNHQKEIEDRLKVEQAKTDAEQRLSVRSIFLKELAESVGWATQAESGDVRPLNDAIKTRIQELQDKFASVQTSDDTLEKILNSIVADYDAVVQRAASVQADFDREVQARSDLQQQKDALERQKTQEIQQLNTDLRAERDRNATNVARSQGTIDDLRNRVSDLEARVVDQAAVAKKERMQLNNQLVARAAQLNDMRDKLLRLEREPNRPDGMVVDATTDLVWIDAGSRNGLKRGTRFDVFELGKGKTKMPKGEIQVREVRGDSAVCAVVTVFDSLNPIVAGDLISNPYYDREKTPQFVLLGRMPGRFGNEEMTQMLQRNGASVVDNVSVHTDFLVVGEKASSDADELPLEETDAFRLATDFGVEIISSQELERLLRF